MDRLYAEALQLAVAEGCVSAVASSIDSSEDASAAHIKVASYNASQGFISPASASSAATRARTAALLFPISTPPYHFGD